MTGKVIDIGSIRAERIPAIVSEKIMRFMDGGNTGMVQLDVKDGRIRSIKITESVIVDSPALNVDRTGYQSQD